jgi:hypothetical protein
MSDIIRLARKLYGDSLDPMMNEASDIKAEYVAGGGNPTDVYSPERMQTLMNEGPLSLLLSQSVQRDDGSVAAPYVPTELALTTNMIEPGAVPAVMAAMNKGINTVSSGLDQHTGKGFAVGRDPNGQVVKLMR